jgi:hypothetical protein
MNTAVSTSTGYRAVEFKFDWPTPDLLKGLMDKAPDQMPRIERVKDKILHAYAKLKFRAHQRKQRRKHGKTLWELKFLDKVLLRSQPVSDAASDVTGKCMRSFLGPYHITNIIPPSLFRLTD